MIELFPNIFYIPGKNKSKFPYCSCLYLKGSRLRVLIDAGMGGENLEPVKKSGFDAVILTHSHIDHRLTMKNISGVPVWAHEAESRHLRDRNIYWDETGMSRSGVDMNMLVKPVPGVFDITVSKNVSDGEIIDLGGLSLVAMHTPGHSPGHMAFYVPEYNLLFSGDIDLTAFGPFYGHFFADIDQFAASIDRLKDVNADMVVTGHTRPLTDDLTGLFDRFRSKIDERDEAILRFLDKPKRLEDFRKSGLIYPSYPVDGGLSAWFELVHISKHLERMKSLGRVDCDSGLWFRRT